MIVDIVPPPPLPYLDRNAANVEKLNWGLHLVLISPGIPYETNRFLSVVINV